MRSPYKFACVRCAARCIPNCSSSKLRDGKQAMLYKYDQLNRITKSRSLALGNNAYAARSGEQKYDEDYSRVGSKCYITWWKLGSYRGGHWCNGLVGKCSSENYKGIKCYRCCWRRIEYEC